jgi:hypothetical protein
MVSIEQHKRSAGETPPRHDIMDDGTHPQENIPRGVAVSGCLNGRR